MNDKHTRFKNQLNLYLSKCDLNNKQSFVGFLESGVNLYSRLNEWGHLTGSAWIVNQDMTQVLLIMHGKYKIWVAPGGHVDHDEIPLEAAIRETEEEVGVMGRLTLATIFDVDVHKIPYSEKKNEPEHWHADVRFLMHGDNNIITDLNLEECDDVQWFDIDSLAINSESNNLKRMAIKTIKHREAAKNLKI